MTREEIKERYEALQGAPEYWGGMNGWYDRIYPFEQFMERGQDVADFMRGKEEFRKEFPALWDLLFKCFPEI
jgi:hypothetical protein